SETHWKHLTVLPHQTVLECSTLAFPVVASETRFLVQWVEAASHIAGVSEVRAFPTNLLAPLKTLAGGGPVGALDPEHVLAPLLARAGVEMQDLGERELDSFDGRLAILGFF